MLFDNKQKISEVDLGWQNVSYVSPVVSTENDDLDQSAENLQFAWFKIEPVSVSGDTEEKEKMKAMQEQFQNKIINKYGLPYGMEMPKELRAIVKEQEKRAGKKGSKWDRQRKRLIDRQIGKDIKSEKSKESSILLNLPISPVTTQSTQTELEKIKDNQIFSNLTTNTINLADIKKD